MPFILPEDIVTLAPVPDQPLARGDIAFFRIPGTRHYFIHRIVGIRKNGYLFKGDNRLTVDASVPLDHIHGIVKAVWQQSRKKRLGIQTGKKAIALLSRINILKLIFFTVKKIFGMKIALFLVERIEKITCIGRKS